MPLPRRFGFHLRRLTGDVDRGFFVRLFLGVAAIVLVASLLVAVVEGPRGGLRDFAGSLPASFYWAVKTVMGSGDASYLQTPAGYVVSWLLVLFGVAIVASVTGALVGFVIDFVIKEGQGTRAAGYRDHIVVCGWNPTARELIQELGNDEYATNVVVVTSGDKNPAGPGVYFVSGDTTSAGDMRSILTVTAVESDRTAGAHRRGGGQPPRTSSTSAGPAPTRSW